MSETNDVNDAIKHFPRLRARTLRFGCGAPRSAQTVGDGSRALFLRSDGPEDLVTALWLSWFSSMRCTPARLPIGSDCCWRGLQMCLVQHQQWPPL